MALVLLVEDERAIAESLEFALRRDGFQVVRAGTLAAAQAALRDSDLVVLDLMLPDGSGFDLLRDMRESGLRTPVIILSSREEEADRVAGLEGGADDYVIKPFSPREVVARVRAVLRRAAPTRPLVASPSSLSGPSSPSGLSSPSGPSSPSSPSGPSGPSSPSGPPRPPRPPGAADGAAPPRLSQHLVVDAETRRASYQGNLLDLTRTEFDLLRVLGSAPERVFTRQQLLDRIFGEGYAVTDRTIDAHIKALRKKLLAAGADPELIETERGVGYRLRELL